VHDALNDPPFINLDLICCRNFLIYLKPTIQQKLLVNFQFALKKNGYLFLGPSESLGKVKSAFDPVNERWNIFKNILETNLRPNAYNRHQLKERKRRDIKQPALSQFEERLIPSNEEIFNNYLLGQYVPLLLFVDEELEVAYINGNADQLLSFPRGPGAFNLTKMLAEEELLVFKNGVRKTLENRKKNVYKSITFKKGTRVFKIDLTFEPVTVRQLDGDYILITIDIRGEGKEGEKIDVVEVDERTYHQERVKTLDLELRQVKSEKQNLVERLETTNEELQSSNEELLAANEELQSTNEELQSVNEELYTVNSELQGKVSELTLSNNDMDNLLKSTGIGTIFVDEMLDIRRFTPAIKKQFNLLSSDIGRPITSFVNTFSNEKIYEDFKKVLKSHKKIEREVVDDKGHPFLMRILPYWLENRKTDGIVATFVDINDIKATSRKAESVAEKFESLFEYSEDFIAILDDTLKLLEANKAYAGFEPEKLFGQNVLELLQSTNQKVFQKALKKAQQSNKAVDFLLEITTKEGKKYYYKQMIVPLIGEVGPKEYLLISKDKTLEKTVQKEALRKAAIYNGLFQYNHGHITILDQEGIIKDVNFTAAGFVKEDIIGLSAYDVARSEENKDKLKKALTAIRTGETSYMYNSDFLDDAEHPSFFKNIVFPVNFGDGETEIIIVSEDVTEEKNLEKTRAATQLDLTKQVAARSKELNLMNLELQEANSYLDSFVHGAAHDLRSPLTQMQGFLTLLPEIDDKNDRNSAYKELGEAAHRMERVLNGLVELIDFKKNVNPILKEINVLEQFREVQTDLRNNLDKAVGKLEVDIPKDLTIYYIEAFLNSVFYNLLHNAVKYRDYNRPLKIKISVKEEKEFVIFKIKDNGVGMDLQRYGHFLFQPFKRLMVERPGTGIGLSIINNSVRRNGGRIEVESQLNRGTTFKVYFKPYDK
ncbi:MAG: PAS domain-containing protein, partial [Bacteroidota bacterium]